ncbi:MAG: glycoside hydrolase family protein [Capsulimonas sp.]|jgi:meiotically up-regulated gene 157 (Mug157) protein|nr:glycoside hydrolase family protein [Capsulimonas sp.]
MNKRPSPAQRCFTSPAIEAAIEEVGGRISDPAIAALFVNCLPNTLDTTVTVASDEEGRPDTFVVTGDIDAMWLRDSTNQVWPYLRFVTADPTLSRLIQGVIHRQARCVLIDAYANAFNREPITPGHWMSDHTEMTPDLHERKYELDSLCAVIRLSAGYYAVSKDASAFDARWSEAMRKIVATIRHEQAGSDEVGKGDYRFQRDSPNPTETLACGGFGQPANRCGLSKSPFRPSDDAAMLPFLVPANAMAVVGLRQLAEIWSQVCNLPEDAADALTLANEIDKAIKANAIIEHPKHGQIIAYEVDGFGSHYLMDDANVPSLLSLPYLGYCAPDDPLYQRTRAFVLSASNPYFAAGQAASGVGSPHTGRGTIWPMALIMQALTSQSEDEIRQCLNTLRDTHAGTWFMHESIWKDDAANYTRSWFAWANTLFGELILSIDAKYPELLASL